MRKLAVAVVLALPGAVGVAASPASAQTPEGDQLFVVDLIGQSEVPPVETAASGVATMVFDDSDDELDVVITTEGLEAVTMAHIHLGAAGENGPVVAGLFGVVEGGETRDGQLTRITIDDDVVTPVFAEDAEEGDPPVFDGNLDTLVAEMVTGNAYVNVHTVANPGGELRGQTATVAPGPAFTDAAGVHAEAIAAIAAAGITVGSSPTTYDQTSVVSRAQMAVFIDRAFGLPAAATGPFNDISDETADTQGAINRVAAAGIAMGTGEGGFAPRSGVSRGAMASFIARALGLSDGAGLGLFADGGPDHGDNIDALNVAGIALGTGNGSSFSTTAGVSRGAMASFLARARGLVEVSPPVERDLTVLHNNDGESVLLPDGEEGGAGRFAATVDAARAEAEAETDGSVLLSSGDNFLAGRAFSASIEDGVFYDALLIERLGYDAVALGNHEFDFGPDVLADFFGEFDRAPQYLSANLDFSGEPALQALVDAGTIAPSTTLEVAGTQIGVVSAITPELPTITNLGEVTVDPDVAGIVQAEIDAFAADGVDTVILISHLQSINEELALIPQLSGIDIVIAGGGSELLADEGDPLLPSDVEDETPIFSGYPAQGINRDGAPVPVVTTNGGYGYLGRLVAQLGPAGNYVGDGEGSALIPVLGGEVDAEVVATVEAPVQAFIEELEATVVAQVEVPLDGLTPNVRTVETNLGNLIADAYVQQVEALTDVEGPIIGLQNGGGIRNNSVIEPGPLTGSDTFSILPFGNFLSVQEGVTPERLLDVVEHSVEFAPTTPNGRFGQFSGIEFTYDADGTAGEKVIDISLSDGTPIVVAGVVVPEAPDVSFALLNFTARGGDGYPLGDLPFEALSITDVVAFETFLQAPVAQGGLGGVVTAADYPTGGEGRITAT